VHVKNFYNKYGPDTALCDSGRALLALFASMYDVKSGLALLTAERELKEFKPFSEVMAHADILCRGYEALDLLGRLPSKQALAGAELLRCQLRLLAEKLPDKLSNKVEIVKSMMQADFRTGKEVDWPDTHAFLDSVAVWLASPHTVSSFAIVTNIASFAPVANAANACGAPAKGCWICGDKFCTSCKCKNKCGICGDKFCTGAQSPDSPCLIHADTEPNPDTVLNALGQKVSEVSRSIFLGLLQRWKLAHPARAHAGEALSEWEIAEMEFEIEQEQYLRTYAVQSNAAETHNQNVVLLTPRAHPNVYEEPNGARFGNISHAAEVSYTAERKDKDTHEEPNGARFGNISHAAEVSYGAELDNAARAVLYGAMAHDVPLE